MSTLYYSPGAASLLVHWLLIELGLPHSLSRVDMQAGEQKRPEYLAINPHGVVPAFVEDDGTVRIEAAAIAMTLADRAGRLAPAQHAPGRVLRRGEASGAVGQRHRDSRGLDAHRPVVLDERGHHAVRVDREVLRALLLAGLHVDPAQRMRQAELDQQPVHQQAGGAGRVVERGHGRLRCATHG